MEQVAAEVMGLPEFDPAAFEKKIQEIRVQMDGSLIYIFRDATRSAGAGRIFPAA